MGMNNTPASERTHIGFFGRMNAGKSSLINALANQPVSIVSAEAGTTTDVVKKTMEIHGIGPCVLLDTAGFDDAGKIGAQRIAASRRAAESADIAVILFSASGDWAAEKEWIAYFRGSAAPVLAVLSHSDERTAAENEALAAKIEAETGLAPLTVSAVTGEGVECPMNLIVPDGTSVAEIIEFAGGFKGGKEPKKVLAGGPMMGIAMSSIDVPLQKGNNAITVLTEDPVEEAQKIQTACIRCGRCNRACPVGLVPQLMQTAAEKKDYDTYENKLYGLECIQCGSCTYICPAKRPLMVLFKQAKTEIMAIKRAEQAKAAAEKAFNEKKGREERLAAAKILLEEEERAAEKVRQDQERAQRIAAEEAEKAKAAAAAKAEAAKAAAQAKAAADTEKAGESAAAPAEGKEENK